MMKVDSHPEADSPSLLRTWKSGHYLRVQRMMGWVRFLPHFAAFFALRPHGSAHFSALDVEEFFVVEGSGARLRTDVGGPFLSVIVIVRR